MLQLLFFSLLMLTFVNLFISNMDYFNPGVVFNFMFTLFSMMCCIVDAIVGLELDNLLTVFIILMGSVCFTFINMISKRTSKKAQIDSAMSTIYLRKSYVYIAIAVEILVVLVMYKYVCDFANIYGVNGTFSEKLSFYDTITKFNTDYKLRMPSYVSVGNLVGRALCYIALYIFINNYVLIKKIDIKMLLVVIIYLVGSLMGGRTEALRIITAALILWYYFFKRKNGWGKDGMKIAIRVGIIAIAIVIGFSLIRGILGRTTYDPVKVVFGYLGAPLKNFDSFISNPQRSINGIWGAMTFTKFINWIGLKFGISNWVYVSDQPFLYFKDFRMGNVYTTYYNFYYDFGVLGCFVLISIIAIYYCRIYNKLKCQQHNNKIIDFRLLLYAYLFNDLIMLPFSSRFYETIVNINFIRLTIILYGLIFIINNLTLKNNRIYIRRRRAM